MPSCVFPFSSTFFSFLSFCLSSPPPLTQNYFYTPYDHGGRLKTLKTWKDIAGNTGTATTTWAYDAKRGFLTSKTYDDATSVTYSNSAAGRLLTRTWDRGITTTYTQNDAGVLESIDYSDTTPDITYIYDRRGRRKSAIQGASTNSFTYQDAGLLKTESFGNSSIIVTNTYDTLLRRTKFESPGKPLTTATTTPHG